MLIGAVALAFVLLGLTAVYSAQLSARPAPTGSAGVDAANAEEFNHEVRRNVRAVAVRTNHAVPYYADRAAVNGSVADETANYSELLAETYASRSGTVAGVDYVRTADYGSRTTTLSNNTTFANPPAAPGTVGTPWSPVDRETEVGWFVLNLNVTAMPDEEPFTVVVENGTGTGTETTKYEFRRNSTGTSVLNVETTTTTGLSTAGGTCNPRSRRSLVDLKTGSVFTSACEVGPGLVELDGPYTVEFRDGENAVGGFSVVTRAPPPTWETSKDLNSLDGCDVTAPSPGPCNTYAVWNVTVQSGYYTDQLSYKNEQNLTVYEGV